MARRAASTPTGRVVRAASQGKRADSRPLWLGQRRDQPRNPCAARTPQDGPRAFRLREDRGQKPPTPPHSPWCFGSFGGPIEVMRSPRPAPARPHGKGMCLDP
jgi:hypothetical protein